MADDLERLMRSIPGEGPSPDFVTTLRERVVAEAEEQASAVEAEDEPAFQIDLRPEAEERQMTKTQGIVAGLAAAAIALVVGFAALSGGDDNEVEAVDAPDQPTAVETETTQEPATTGADADAGCGLSERAAIIATVDESGEMVTFDITSGPTCSGVDVTVSATPAIKGLPIQRTATLDDAGAASLTDQLLGTRQGAQEWSVALIVSDTGGVAATGDFAVAAVCDPEASADLEATYLPETHEVDIVFTVDPICAGETFTFDDAEIFASSPVGGWEVYTVDVAGRIEVTEQLVVPGPIIAVNAIPVAAERGVTTGPVASVVLDIGD